MVGHGATSRHARMTSASRISSASCGGASANRPRWARHTISRERSLTDGRLSVPQELVDPVGRQRRQVGRGQLDRPRVLTAHRSAPARESSWRGCAGAGPRGVPQSPATRGHARVPRPDRRAGCACLQEDADPTAPAVVVQPLGQRLGLAQHLQHRWNSTSCISTGRRARRTSKASSSTDRLSGNASSAPSACSNHTRASASAERAAAFSPACRR